MEIKQIKDLMAAMGRTRMKRLKVTNNGFELELEREDKIVKQVVDHPQEASFVHAYEHSNAARSPDIPASLHPPVDHEPKKTEEGAQYIVSPMVGTMYTSPGPDEPPFVKVGDGVTEDTVVCIIEAMKVMNEVKAGAAGVVTEVMVENGHPVEFGTKLFKVK